MKNAEVLIQRYMTTSLVTIKPQHTAVQAFQVVTVNRIRHLPVVDEEGIVIGMISDRDLLGADPDTEVQYLMNQPARVVNVHDGLENVIDLMLESKVSSCLVEDESEVVGIITSEDLLRVLKNHLSHPSKGSVRTALYDYVIRYPLGAAAQTLANAGI